MEEQFKHLLAKGCPCCQIKPLRAENILINAKSMGQFGSRQRRQFVCLNCNTVLGDRIDDYR